MTRMIIARISDELVVALEPCFRYCDKVVADEDDEYTFTNPGPELLIMLQASGTELLYDFDIQEEVDKFE